MSDEYNLQRFVDAQEGVYDRALRSIHNRILDPAWMAFIFPRFVNCYHDDATSAFAIASLDEARAYLAHPVLGARLRESVAALMAWAGRKPAEQILGPVDTMKLRSCLTLFEAASGDRPFGHAIDAFFDGRRDDVTLRLLTKL